MPLSQQLSTAEHICLAAQPSSVFGSPDMMVERGVDETLAITGALAAAIVKAVSGNTTAASIERAINGAAKRFGSDRIAKPIRRELLHGAMLGALDASWEADEDRAIAVESFGALHQDVRRLVNIDTRFSARPLSEAIKAFLKRKPVTRDVFDQMEDAAKKASFTVANAANEEMVRTVKRELARQLALGADLADFGKHAAARFESAGWVPRNGSHLEVVFRTNTLRSYNEGRARQMIQPSVLADRKYWEILTANDGPPRQRPTHQAAHGVVLLATDPFWARAYPPFGFACRCRCRSLSNSRGQPRAVDGSSIRGLPDPGFASGLSQLDLPKVQMPKQPANDTRPANDPPPRQSPAND